MISDPGNIKSQNENILLYCLCLETLKRSSVHWKLLFYCFKAAIPLLWRNKTCFLTTQLFRETLE